MANLNDFLTSVFGSTTMLASPNQSSTVFNPDGRHPIRQKHLFAVRFIRTVNASAEWREGLTFVAKTMDRPSVQPSIEELNQYNKKRIVHTGVKYNPVNCSFYDTADGAAMNMWVDYAKYYFNDYNQTSDAYHDDLLDVTRDNTLNSSGFGFAIHDSLNAPDGIGTQHFFDKVIVYQFWSHEYTAYELVNPRITSFNPDELSYEESNASVLTMTMSYEAVNHINGGRPIAVSSEEQFQNIFDNGPFNGKTLEVSGAIAPNSYIDTVPDNPPSIEQFGQIALNLVDNIANGPTRSGSASSGGVLNRFGSFDFGGTASSLASSIGGSGNLTLGGSDLLGSILNGGYTPINNTAGLTGLGTDANIANLQRSINLAALNTNTAPIDQSSDASGLTLSNAATEALNATSDGTYQYGFTGAEASGFLDG